MNCACFFMHARKRNLFQQDDPFSVTRYGSIWVIMKIARIPRYGQRLTLTGCGNKHFMMLQNLVCHLKTVHHRHGLFFYINSKCRNIFEKFVKLLDTQNIVKVIFNKTTLLATQPMYLWIGCTQFSKVGWLPRGTSAIKITRLETSRLFLMGLFRTEGLCEQSHTLEKNI